MADINNLTKSELIRLLRDSHAALASDKRGEKRLLHDLQTHQIELELQNRELREAQQALEVARDRYADLYDSAPVGYLTLDRRGVVLEANLTVLTMLRVSHTMLIGWPITRYVAKGSVATLFRYLSELGAVVAEESVCVEIEVQPHRGEARQVRLDSRVIYEDDEQLRFPTVMLDITEQKVAEQQMRLAAQVIENTQEGVMVIDADLHIESVNPAFETITGYSAKEALGQTPSLLKSGRHDDEFYRAMWQELVETGGWQGEIWNRSKSGDIYPEWLNIRTIRNENGGVAHYIGVFSDISSQKQAQKQLHNLAYYDALTKLPNRQLYHDRLRMSLIHAQREKSGLAVMFIDLDRFKSINDTLGHGIGDKVLQDIARRLTQTLREGDTTCRLGGDEFTVIISDIEQVDLVGHVAVKLLEACSLPIVIEQHTLYLTISIGISLFPEDGSDTEELMKNADIAMYRAKNEGGGQFQFYKSEMGARSLERLSLEHELRVALEQGQLQIAYQPQLSMRSGKWLGVEALARWQHPTQGCVSPSVFIPVAEETGVIDDIGIWMLREACTQQKAWLDAGFEVGRMAVNCSMVQLRQDRLPTLIAQILEETGLPASMLELEVTESVFMGKADNIISVLQAIGDLGVEITVDDFGTGFSSLSRLKHLPIDRVKIDRSFVKGLPQNLDDASIVTTIIAMARAMKLEVVAEGVETESQKELLQELGCDSMQGFLFSLPKSATEIGGMMRPIDTYK